MVREMDITWQHCSCVTIPNKKHLRCNYCKKTFHGGVHRMKHHLARDHSNAKACDTNPDEVVALFKSILKKKKDAAASQTDDLADLIDLDDTMEEDTEIGIDSKKRKLMGGTIDAFLNKEKKAKQTTLNAQWKKEDREKVCQDICRFIYACALPFNLVKSPFFASMIESVSGFGKGLKIPSYHEVRNNFLVQEVDNVKGKLEVYKEQWKKVGCTIMSDGWTDTRRRSITNFLVNIPRGTVFLKSVMTADITKDAENIFKLLDRVVDIVGEENVVQVVTDSAAAYVKAGEKLMDKRKHLFWTPCAAHCLDSMLEDIGDMEVHADTYRFSFVLNLMRHHTEGRELTRPAVTRFATQYLTLKSILEQRGALRRMFTSVDWESSEFPATPEGAEVENIILKDDVFWKGITFCLKTTIPLVKVLRLVDGDAKPAMGYIYEAMDQAKEKIAENLGGLKKRYQDIWDIIDKRWDAALHRPLHAAGKFLNPKYRYDNEMDYEIKKGLHDCIERMVPSKKDRAKIDRQLDIFSLAQGEFGREMAIDSRKTKQPALWWESYGSHCPELQKLAIRILSLTCSATGCERNWSIFDQIHTKRRNKLEQERLNALVFVKYNLQLEIRHNQRKDNYGLDLICLSDLDSDDEWITEREDPTLPLDTTWMDVNNDCFKSQYEEGSNSKPKKKKRGPRNTQYKAKEKAKGKGLLVDEDEDEWDYDLDADDEEELSADENESDDEGEDRNEEDDIE